MPLDYEYGYTIAPPKPLDPSESQWQKVYNDFLENGTGYEKYRPGYKPPEGDTTGFAGGGTAPAVGQDAVGEDSSTVVRGTDPGVNEEATSVRNQGAGSPIRDIPDPPPGVNPVDAGEEFIDRLNKEFPGGLKGSDPNRFEQFMAEYGHLAVAGLGWLSGIPGMGWLAKKVRNWYWRNNQWQSPVPPDAPQPSSNYDGSNLVDEILGNGPDGLPPESTPRQSPVMPPEQFRRMGYSPFYQGTYGSRMYDRWGNRHTPYDPYIPTKLADKSK